MLRNKLVFTLIMIIFMIISCNKSDNPVELPANNTHTYTADEMALWRKLNGFNQKIKNGLKSEEFITPDSAMWYLEALFNVQQASDTTFDEVKSYERTYTLNVNTNGTVNMSDVVSLYNQLTTDLNEELALIDSDYKFLIIADLKEESLISGGFTITLSGGLGINPLAYYQPLDSSDNWRYGHMHGHCGSSNDWSSDGGQELLRRFNHPYIYYPPGTFWTDVFTTNDLSNSNYSGRIFHQVCDSIPCMEFTELQYYLAQGHYIIYNSSNETPSGEKPMGLSFHCMTLWTNDEPAPNNTYWHKYKIYYGIPSMLPEIR